MNFELSGVKGLVLYKYNDFIREALYKLKGCGDIELASIFLNYRMFPLRYSYNDYVIIPVPSNEEDDAARGFNHVVEIFKTLGLPIHLVLKKKYKFKQSDLSKEEREKIDEKLEISNAESIKNKKVLLVDDVYTTGSTLKACIKLLKCAGVKHIKLLVIAHPVLNDTE